MGIDKFSGPTILEVLNRKIPIENAIIETAIINLHMIASNITTAPFEMEMVKWPDMK